MNTLKIKPAKLSDRIVEQMEHMLLEGTFAPGQKLPTERELAEQFDVLIFPWNIRHRVKNYIIIRNEVLNEANTPASQSGI